MWFVGRCSTFILYIILYLKECDNNYATTTLTLTTAYNTNNWHFLQPFIGTNSFYVLSLDFWKWYEYICMKIYNELHIVLLWWNLSSLCFPKFIWRLNDVIILVVDDSTVDNKTLRS